MTTSLVGLPGLADFFSAYAARTPLAEGRERRVTTGPETTVRRHGRRSQRPAAVVAQSTRSAIDQEVAA